jgi:hypothetical protein
MLLAGFATSGQAQDKFSWKLKVGDVFFVQQTRKVEQKMEVDGDDIRWELNRSSVAQFKILSDKDGKLTLQEKIEAITLTNAQDSPGVKEMLSRLSGATLTFHLDGDFHVSKVEGYDQLVQKLAQGDAGLEQTARAVLPEATFRAAVEQLFDFLPPNTTGKGKPWENTATEPLGPFGNLKITNHWSLANKGSEPDTIRIGGTQKILLDTGQAAKSLPFQVKAGAVKKADAKLEVVFDAAKGRLKQRTIKRQMHVHLLVEKDKRKLDLRIEQQTTETVEVLDKKPDKK